METFIKHPEFHKLNVGFALDEGKQTTHTDANTLLKVWKAYFSVMFMSSAPQENITKR